MNLQQLKESINENKIPNNLSVYLKALWYDAKGNWDEAHQIIQDVPDKNASWIHAYLHRKEGDMNNADYWYNQAERKRPNISLNEEWEEIVKAML